MHKNAKVGFMQFIFYTFVFFNILSFSPVIFFKNTQIIIVIVTCWVVIRHRPLFHGFSSFLGSRAPRRGLLLPRGGNNEFLPVAT